MTAHKELKQKLSELADVTPYTWQADAVVDASNLITELVEALEMVEEWWLEQGKEEFIGAPACIFKVREALAKYKGER